MLENEYTFEVDCCLSGTSLKDKPFVQEGTTALKKVCEAEAELFHKYLCSCGEKEYENGLADWEKSVVAGYLYQKLKNRF